MISIVIPTYNEGATVQGFIAELGQVFNKGTYEVIIVDDGSTDGCCDALTGDALKVVRHPRNRGYGAALKTGILASSGDVIVTCDSDGQHRAADVAAVAGLLEKHDFVVGARGKDSHAPLLRRPGKMLLGMIANYLAETKIPDLNSGLRAFKRNVILRMLHLMPEGFSFSTTSTLAAFKMGYDVHYTSIKVEKRVGTSTVSQVRHGAQTILLIIRLITLFNPMKVFMPVSVLLFLAGIAQFAAESIINRIHITPTTVILFIASLLVFCFGIVTDQVSAMRREMSVYDRNA